MGGLVWAGVVVVEEEEEEEEHRSHVWWALLRPSWVPRRPGEGVPRLTSAGAR